MAALKVSLMVVTTVVKSEHIWVERMVVKMAAEKVALLVFELVVEWAASKAVE